MSCPRAAGSQPGRSALRRSWSAAWSPLASTSADFTPAELTIPPVGAPSPAGAGDGEQVGAGPYDRRVGLEGPCAGHRVDEEPIRALSVGRVQSRHSGPSIPSTCGAAARRHEVIGELAGGDRVGDPDIRRYYEQTDAEADRPAAARGTSPAGPLRAARLSRRWPVLWSRTGP